MVLDSSFEIQLHAWDPLPQGLGEELRAGLELTFSRRVRWAGELEHSEIAYDEERAQYLSTSYLDLMSKVFKSGAEFHLGLCSRDLFIPDLNFTFAEADPALRVAILSTARLDPQTYGEPQDMKRFSRRVLGEAIHAIGDLAGLEHCENPECVMWLSSSIEETDHKGLAFCELHRLRLHQIFSRPPYYELGSSQ